MNIEKAIKSLELRGYSVKHFATGAQAADYLAQQIRGCTVGIGGSKTAEQLGLFEKLSEANSVYWHWKVPGPETIEKANAADVYISGANAMTEDGEILNIDGLRARSTATSAFTSSPGQTSSARISTLPCTGPGMWLRYKTADALRITTPARQTTNATTAAWPAASAGRCWCSGGP